MRAFGYFNQANLVVDSGTCGGGILGGAGVPHLGYLDASCKGQKLAMTLGTRVYHSYKEVDGVKEFVLASDSERRQGDITFIPSTNNPSVSSQILTCTIHSYGPNQSLDSIPVF